MLTAARRGPASRYDVLAELFDAFDRIGLDVDRLAFVVPVDGIHPGDPAAAEALNRLGVADDRLAYAPRRWAAPFGQEGPTGPNLFVLTDRTAVPCGDSCGPSCGCGRYLHFWNCEFLGGSPASAGTTAMQSIVDSAGGLERLWSAATGQDMHAGPLLRSITATTSRYVPADAARTVADHARSVALLLAAGIRPAGRGRGHVLRRLTRRAGALLVQNDADPAVLRSAVAAAQACAGGVGGFGTVSAEAFAWLDDEIVCCRESVARSSQLFRHWTRDIPVGADITHLAFRLRAERGMPLLLVRQWSTRDGFRVDEPVLASLFAAEKVSSRSSALAARVAARWEAKPPGLRTLPSPRSAEPSVPQRR
jgi:alanyl-tRNA synthetase